MYSDRSRLLDHVGGVEDVQVEEGACVVGVAVGLFRLALCRGGCFDYISTQSDDRFI